MNLCNLKMPESRDWPDFVILTPGRSGSELLVSLLDSHRQVRCAGEILGSSPLAPHDPERELAFVKRATRDSRTETDKPVFGFKLPLWCIPKPSRLLANLVERGTRCIVLTRTNKLDMVLSIELARVNHLWGSTDRYDRQSIDLDPEGVVAQLQALEDADARMQDLTSGYPRVFATYEAIAGDYSIPLIQDFLGLSIEKLRPRTVRGRTVSRTIAIRNFDAVAERIRGTGFEHFLRDDCTDSRFSSGMP